MFGWFGGGGPDGTRQFFESVGVGPRRQNAIASGISETAGGALLAAGLATPVAAAALSGTMATAVWAVHKDNGPWVTQGGCEYNLVLMGLLFAIADLGPGPWSLDEKLGLERSGPAWALRPSPATPRRPASTSSRVGSTAAPPWSVAG